MSEDFNHGYLAGKLGSALRMDDKRLDKSKFGSDEKEKLDDDGNIDEDTKRARNIEKLSLALQGLRSRTIAVGSRQPTDAPSWVTLEVAHGGFATGRYLAALREGETPNEAYLEGEGLRQLADMLRTGRFRVQVPEHGALLVVVWLTTQGDLVAAEELLEKLTPWMHSLRFYPDAADTPLEVTSEVSIRSAGEVLSNLNFYTRMLSNINIRRINSLWLRDESVEYWQPLKWRMLNLFAETLLCNHIPRLAYADPSLTPDWAAIEARGGSLRRGVGSAYRPPREEPQSDRWGYPIHAPDENVERKVERNRGVKNRPAPKYIAYPECEHYSNSTCDSRCGWPCLNYPADWIERARGLVNEHHELMVSVYIKNFKMSAEQAEEHFQTKLLKRGGVYSLFNCLTKIKQSGVESLTGREVGVIRTLLAGSNTKRGMPGDDIFEAFWSKLADQRTGICTQTQVCKEVTQRLKEADPTTGCDEALMATFLAPCEAGPIPASIQAKLAVCETNSLEALVMKGLIPSGEVLAELVPKVMAAATIIGCGVDMQLQRITYALRVSFSKRRSLLLLNLQSQVKMQELPWATVVLDACAKTSDTRLVAKQALEEIVMLNYKTFPQTIIVNKLLSSLKTLVDAAGLTDTCPITEELAVDIFEGRFSEKFVAASRIAASILRGSIYERYYDIEQFYRDVLTTEGTVRGTVTMVPGFGRGHNMARTGIGTAHWFGECCTARARLPALPASESRYAYRKPAENGQIVEQQQILTTHNLASFFGALSLASKLDCLDLSRRTWQWILKEMNNLPEDYRNMLRVCKNVAYAWRQLLFYSSFVEDTGLVIDMLTADMSAFAEAPASLRTRLTDLLLTPLQAVAYAHADASGRTGGNAAVTMLLAWVTNRHPLLPPAAGDPPTPLPLQEENIQQPMQFDNSFIE